MKDFHGAEDLFGAMLQRGEAVPFDVHHRHFLSSCEGTLWIQNDSILFEPRMGSHHVEFMTAQVRVFRVSGDTVRFEIRNQKNKRKRFAFFPTAVTEPDEEAVDLVVPDEYHDDRGKLLHVMTRLWETHIQ